VSPGTSFDISLPQGCSMPNINPFWPMVHEMKIFEDLSKCSLFCPLLGQTLYLNKSESPSMFPAKFG